MDLLEFVRGCTFDDFLLTPQCGVLPRRDPDKVDLSARFTEHLTLNRPLVSANMDTVTRAAMAIVLAEEGGIGVIDRGFRAGDIEPQVTEVAAVKRRQHGIISDPHSIGPDRRIADAIRLMEQTGVGTLAVVDAGNRLVGLLTERDVRFVPQDSLVSERMTPRDALVKHTGPLSLADAERLMIARKIKKLPLVDGEGRLAGLMTAKDVLKHKQHPFATRDAQGRLRVGAAVGAVGDYLERAVEVVRAGADLLVIDIAHGHSLVMEKALADIRKRIDSIDVVAGNVATAEGARFLLDRGANAIKVGIGPGGGCSTRSTTNFGIPQVEALVRCRREVDGARAAHRGRRHPPRRQHRARAPVRRRYGDARQRVRWNRRGAGRRRLQVGRRAGVAEDRQSAVQGVPRDGLDQRRPRSPRPGGRRPARAGGDRRGGHRGKRPGPRLGPCRHPGHAQTSLLGGQLRRRHQPR